MSLSFILFLFTCATVLTDVDADVFVLGVVLSVKFVIISSVLTHQYFAPFNYSCPRPPKCNFRSEFAAVELDENFKSPVEGNISDDEVLLTL